MNDAVFFGCELVFVMAALLRAGLPLRPKVGVVLFVRVGKPPPRSALLDADPEGDSNEYFARGLTLLLAVAARRRPGSATLRLIATLGPRMS